MPALTLDDIVSTSAAVGATRGRLAKVRLLADLLRRADPDEVGIAVSWLAGAARQGRIGVGYAALRDAAGTPAAAPSLSVVEVDARLDAVLATRGAGSAAARRDHLADVFGRATADEQRFLFGLLVGEVRQGALEGVMVEAIAEAANLPAADVRRAVMLAGAVPPVAAAVLGEGAAGLARFAVVPFQPLRPMLAQTAEDADAALARFAPAAFELKLDGARVQVHKAGDSVRIYTRELNDVTVAAPEIVAAVAVLPAETLILDGEAIVFRPDGRPQPFQVTMRRFGRKVDVDALRDTLPLSVMFFDCLYRDGVALVDRPQAERVAALAEVLPEALRVPSLVTADPHAAAAFVDEAFARGHEGVMAKAPDGPYEAGARGAGWLKIKRAHTLDLVVLAAEWGHGRRRGWLSNLHLGAYDPEAGGFVMLGKTFKGMTDAMLAWQTEHLEALATARDAHVVTVRPALVVEVAFNDIQASPHYPGGLALRFARIKSYRLDKRPEDADTIGTVRTLFDRQSG